jgi:hypothetical protein
MRHTNLLAPTFGINVKDQAVVYQQWLNLKISVAVRTGRHPDRSRASSQKGQGGGMDLACSKSRIAVQFAFLLMMSS